MNGLLSSDTTGTAQRTTHPAIFLCFVFVFVAAITFLLCHSLTTADTQTAGRDLEITLLIEEHVPLCISQIYTDWFRH
jgi:hypothetical protein